jgi:hypothetical protein
MPRSNSSHKTIARSNHRPHSRFELLEARRLLAAHLSGSATTYSTIQAAVDAALPSAVITVDAGSYAEMVTVYKPLTIRGARAGIDARSNARINGSPAAESIITGYDTGAGISTSFYIASDGVTIDGFTVQGNTTTGGRGAGVVIAPQVSGTHIVNNIIQNNVSGLFLSNFDSAQQALIQHNVFRNNNNNGDNGGRGIYTDGGISGGNLTNVVIDGNAFFNNRGSTGTTRLEAAIAFEAQTAGKQSNITISNNSFDANGKATLFFNTTGVTITGNAITNTLDQYSGTLRFEGNNHDVTIQNNTVYDNTGPAVAVDAKGVPGDSSGFIVTQNNFYNNSLAYGSRISVVFDGSMFDGAPDVRNNYWGSPTGPGGDGPGAGDKVYGIGHVVPGGQWSVATGGNELFSPWASAPIGTLRSPYFGAPAGDGAIVQVEDYDHGGEGSGYHDSTSSNSGGKYRTREGADIEATSDAGGGFDIYNAVAGEWLVYAVNLANSGAFNLDLRVATAQTTGGAFHVEIDGQNVTGALRVPRTGGNQVWTTLTAAGLNLSAGPHTLRLVLDSNGSAGTVGSFNWFKLTNTSIIPTPPPAAPTNLLALAANSSLVKLTWTDNATGETGYLIERKSGAAGAWQSIATLSADAVAYADGSVAGNTTYVYRVRATSAVGDSANSNEAAVTTPAAPNALYLSDLAWVSATNGWGPVERDTNVGGSSAGDGTAIKLAGVTYSKGLGTNATSDIVYNLAGGYQSFMSDIGVDDKQTVDGTVVFQVFADGTLIYDSGIMTAASATRSINLNVAGVQSLRLHVGDGGDDESYDWADWADAKLTLADTPPASPTAPAAPTDLLASAADGSPQIDLTWTDASDNETGFVIERSNDGVRGWAQIATPPSNVSHYSDTALASGTKYFYRIHAFNDVGASSNSNIASATTAPAPQPALPSGWTNDSIGKSSGDATFSSGTYTLTGSGAGTVGRADALNFTYTTLTGNGTLIARVTNSTDLAGIMFRNSLDAGSKEIGLAFDANGAIQFSRRTSTGGSTSTTVAKASGATWLKLVRGGNTISAYRSIDGASWTLIGKLKVGLTSTIYVGLFVASGSATATDTGSFDNVSVIPA